MAATSRRMKRSLLTLAAVGACLAPAAAHATNTAPACVGAPTTAPRFAVYLGQVGQPGWNRLQLAPTSSCGPTAAATSRLFTLLRALPAKPTPAKLHAVVRSAIAVDTAYVAQVNEYVAGTVASFTATHRCGQAPNPPGMCDNGTLPMTARDVLLPAGVDPVAVQADIASLRLLLSR